MSEERTPVSPEALAAAWETWHERHGGKLGPGPAFAEALAAGMAVDLAAAREAGRLEGDAAGYRRGMEEAMEVLLRHRAEHGEELRKAAGDFGMLHTHSTALNALWRALNEIRLKQPVDHTPASERPEAPT